MCPELGNRKAVFGLIKQEDSRLLSEMWPVLWFSQYTLQSVSVCSVYSMCILGILHVSVCSVYYQSSGL